MTISVIAICTNAARLCSRLLDIDNKLCRDVADRMQGPIFSSALVLLLTVWSGGRMGLEGSYDKEIQNVDKCLRMLSHAERCWRSAGQLDDIIRSLVDASDLGPPVPSHRRVLNPPTTIPALKRLRLGAYSTSRRRSTLRQRHASPQRRFGQNAFVPRIF